MRLDHVNLLLAIIGIALSARLEPIALLVIGATLGLALGVLFAPKLGRASARLAFHLGQAGREPPAASTAAALTGSDDQP